MARALSAGELLQSGPIYWEHPEPKYGGAKPVCLSTQLLHAIRGGKEGESSLQPLVFQWTITKSFTSVVKHGGLGGLSLLLSTA